MIHNQLLEKQRIAEEKIKELEVSFLASDDESKTLKVSVMLFDMPLVFILYFSC